MIETLIVVLGVALLAGMGVVLPLVPAAWVVGAGWACTAAGMLLGVPTGLWYHVRLRGVLGRRGALPARWWLRPAALHPRLHPEERAVVLPWFYAGGAGFLLSVLGCLVVAAGVVLQAHRAGLL